MWQTMHSPSRPFWMPQLNWRRLLTAIGALVAAAIERQGEYLLEMERLGGRWSIVDMAD